MSEPLTEPGTDARPRQALLLAAGDGTRLRPLTERIPKPMLPIDGQAVIERLLAQLQAVGVERATVVIGHQGELLRDFLESSDRGVALTFVTQDERRGSAHALQLALAGGLDPTDTIVAASDTWWRDEDVSGIAMAAASDPDVLVTMGLLRWPVAQLPHSSATLVDATGHVERVLHEVDPVDEQPDATALAGSPIYVFRAAFWSYVEAIQPSPSGAIALATGIQRAIDDGRSVRAYEVHGARDLTRPDDLLRHNFAYLGRWLDAANHLA